MEIVSACLLRDLPTYRRTFRSLRTFFPLDEIHLITRRQDFQKFRNACGRNLHLWDENDLIPKMTLAELRKKPLPFFPGGAGWYFQQFLKYAFMNVSNAEEHFLIWDADTIALRKIDLFDALGHPCYTEAEEYHRPYFETFEALFGTPADRSHSFISQHQLVSKVILKQMLSEIEARHPSSNGWAWAIVDNLKGEGSNLFSEYETYGHYLKMRHPDTFSTRTRQWTRRGGGSMGIPPWRMRLRQLAKHYDFAAFEATDSQLRRVIRRFRGFIRI